MKTILLFAIALLFAIQANAQNASANRSTAYAVKANKHKKRSVPHSVTRQHNHGKRKAGR
jgi:hypothetical protein